MKTRKAKRTLARTRKSPPKAAQSAGDKAALSALRDLEPTIRDLQRAANVAFLMTMREEESEGLALYAVEQVERHASELRKQFYRAAEGKAA